MAVKPLLHHARGRDRSRSYGEKVSVQAGWPDKLRKRGEFRRECGALLLASITVRLLST